MVPTAPSAPSTAASIPGGVGVGDLPAIFRATDLSPLILLVSILTAAALGAGHALTPGHGKTLMAAYLVGTRGTPLHAAGLGLSVTVSHTLGILVLAALVVGAEGFLPPDVIVRSAPVIAAVSIVVIGGWMLFGEGRRRWRLRATVGSHAHEDEHEHDHDHDHAHAHDHAAHASHDDSVSSVSLTLPGAMNLAMVNAWLGALLEVRADDLYRFKGILAIDGYPNRYVFQGVHALFAGEPGKAWGEGEERVSRMVFIGRELDAGLLREGFEECLAGTKVAGAEVVR